MNRRSTQHLIQAIGFIGFRKLNPAYAKNKFCGNFKVVLVYLGVGCSWLAYKLWNIGLNKTPAHIGGMLIALEPVFGVLFAFLFLGERMSLLTALGSALVIGSAILSTVILILKEKRQLP